MFKFKQFSIKQEKSAMKVGTDGVLLGAWCDVENTNSALDIGCGTGLIALMLAQKKAKLKIDAVEISAESATEAEENVQNSPFKEQISVFCDSIQNFAEKCDKKYDLIVSNPPFFVDSLKCPNEKRALARHTDTLPYCDLFFAVEKLLNENGLFSVILPEEQCESFINSAKNHNLFLTKQTEVFSKPQSKCHRRLMTFSSAFLTQSSQRERKERKDDYQKFANFANDLCVKKEKLIIENSRHNFTDEYISLTKDFYLKF